MRVGPWLLLGSRWALTGAAAGAAALAGVSYFAAWVDFRCEAYHLGPDGRVAVYLPFEWAQNEYCETFPFDADSLFGVVEYWLPRGFEPEWRPSGSYESRGLDRQWWGAWLWPFDFHTDGEYGETGAHPIPVQLLVYATGTPCAAWWCVPAWARRRRALRGCCRACGYSLAGLAAGVKCPECGAGR